MHCTTVFILGREKGYTVKYNILPEGVPDATPEGKGIYLTVYPESSPSALLCYQVMTLIDKIVHYIFLLLFGPVFKLVYLRPEVEKK